MEEVNGLVESEVAAELFDPKQVGDACLWEGGGG